MKKISILTILSSALLAAGPFGLELSKSTIDDALNVLDCNKEYSKSQFIDGVYKNNGYYLEFNNCKMMDNISTLVLGFNDDKVLEYAAISFNNKDNFKNLKQSLQSKYKITSSVEPFVGDKIVEFSDKNQIIKLEAMHMSFSLSLSYYTKDFEVRINKALKEKERKKQEKNTNML
ncbi:hypothetical protein [Campylobacter canadensis]|uniref:Uncharacterized protein n=1 Tax=Campylobacter canadensis TaxID=449520 RepID=A0ABS7WRR1_9BACT|nr:hypothetical protein [Campylobacter canadensis]MBZ7987438.1 hypothetical protein [Campylobacter canadensis]MBZ7995380.1 hypothetical protein [Campylobacter canadensis]MBZ7998633.1 hypothetical protein [Campylobacter canadensis]MBZ8000716.1 hypothetical protein [Campylobacter canadensis]MBZ8002003.1 hypothetical protein [Campylobacter canadensis]